MKKRILSEKMLENFEHHLLLEEKSRHTIEKYRRDLRTFMHFAGEMPINKEMTVKYKEEIGGKYKKTSANSILAALNSFLRFVGWEDCCVRQFKVQKSMFCDQKKELTRAEYLRLCTAAEKIGNERLSLVLQTLGGTGIRVSELPYITVETLSEGKAVVSCKNKTRTVFIVKPLQKKLLCYCRNSF